MTRIVLSLKQMTINVMQRQLPSKPSHPLLWDVFCRVIDNFGDIGVCWRLCADLGARGHQVRLWVDDSSPLAWMAPGALEGSGQGVRVLLWEQSKDAAILATLHAANVWVEGFGCEIPAEFLAWNAQLAATGDQGNAAPAVWVNLEYLSAEPFVERSHGLPSPVMNGPAKGRTKYFVYPGFTARTGGLLREPDLLLRHQVFAQRGQRAEWLARQGIAWAGEHVVSLFCYEPPALPALLALLDGQHLPTRLLVTAGRARKAVETALAERHAINAPGFQNLRISYLPVLSQQEFDLLMWASDLNFVRGEDSLVRAIWAGKPLVWQIYPQDDAAHVLKLDAFLDVVGASASMRAFHHAWNSTERNPVNLALSLMDLNSWSQTVHAARARLLQMDDLVTQLVQFVLKKR